MNEEARLLRWTGKVLPFENTPIRLWWMGNKGPSPAGEW